MLIMSFLGLINPIDQEKTKEKVHLEIKAKTLDDLKHSIYSEDPSKIEVNKNLF